MTNKLTKLRIGQVLVDEKIIEKKDIETILEHQVEHGTMFGESAIMLQMVTEQQLLECLIIQCNIPYIDLNQYDVDPDLFIPYPKMLLSKCIAIPIEKIGTISVFAISQPLSPDLKGQIEELAGGRIFFVLSQMSVIKEVVDNVYKILKRKQEESSDLTELGKMLIDKEKTKSKKKVKKKSSD